MERLALKATAFQHNIPTFPLTLVNLDLTGSIFQEAAPDLSYLVNLQQLNLKKVRISNWLDVIFPNSLKKLQLNESNFNAAFLNNLTDIEVEI